VVAQRAPSVPEGAASGGPAGDTGDSSNQIGEADGSTGELDTAGLQIITMLDSLRDLVHGRSPDLPPDGDRLKMLSTAIGRDDEPLSTHLVNRLYRRRRELCLSHVEHTCWFRTLLADIGLRPEAVHRVVPGWGIIDLTSTDTATLLLQYAKYNDNASRGALRTLQRLKMRPAELWPRSLRPPGTSNMPEEHDVAAGNQRTARWVEILNQNPGLGAALDYLLQDLDSDSDDSTASLRALLTQILEGDELHENSRSLIDSACQALDGDPEALADALRYSSDEEAPWRLVLRYASELSPKLLNQFAVQTINRQARLAAITAGLATRKLSDDTLTKLLRLDDDYEIADLLIESAEGDADRALQLLTVMRKTKEGLRPAETEARLMAVAESPENLKRLLARPEYSVRPWEALTYSIPDEMTDEAREVLQTNAAALRAELVPRQATFALAMT
jgi:hypothetical protein